MMMMNSPGSTIIYVSFHVIVWEKAVLKRDFHSCSVHA